MPREFLSRRLMPTIVVAVIAATTLLCVTACLLWLRSYRAADEWYLCRPVRGTSAVWIDRGKNAGTVEIPLRPFWYVKSAEGYLRLGWVNLNHRFPDATHGTVIYVKRTLESEEGGTGGFGKWMPNWRLKVHTSNGFSFDDGQQFQCVTGRGVVFPHWLLVVAASVVPGAVAYRIGRRRHRVKFNYCANCGY